MTSRSWPWEGRLEAKLKFLIDDVKHHVKKEEGELFPKAKEILGEPKPQELGTKMEEHKMAKVGKK
jgi:hemerythrin-like domain-containing protein